MNKLPVSLESIAFALQQAAGIGSTTLRRTLRRIVDEGISASHVFALENAQIRNRLALPDTAIEELRHPSPRTVETWEELQRRGVYLMVLGQPDYPHRLASLLGESAPPILYALGARTIVDLPSVGFCGSRKASEKGLQVARECAQLLAQEHINVVSGYAHGVDMAAHEGALEAGGTTVLALAEGILHFRPKQQIKPFIEEAGFERIAVVSEFPPNLPWKAHNAMTRNRTICGLSNALIVIESGLEGGTFEAGKTALDLGEPLFCVEYAEPAPSAPGNSYFLQRGAASLKRSRSGKPNLAKVVATARNGLDSPISEQIELQLRERRAYGGL
jgi:DNA protecting protein DprA